jgi:hypothetical protein
MLMKNPTWWNEKHEGTWDRVKSALKRDWEQTKADVSKKGHELNQGIGDTVKQAAGKQPIPPTDMPNPRKSDEKWEDVEPTYRFGVGARGEIQDEWNPDVESRLQKDWGSLQDDRKWDEVRNRVRRAYDYDPERNK